MKEAIITDLNGLFVDVDLVDDSETGYLLLTAPDDPYDNEDAPITGYRVALPVPGGLYRPRFDREAYDLHQAAEVAHAAAMVAWLTLPEEERGPEPFAPEAPAFWVEGLTPEEIEALQPAPPEPTPDQLRIEQLEVDNALLLLDLAETQARQQQGEQDNALLLLSQAETEARLQKAEQDQAALLLTLVEGGVI
ncbi:hypothetical protein M3223_08880 [Paenibacillus pasadenensis]|uniref:hypothetical protein n=1 Tax=Paenibacillus pasadenensis TaxID=217090 RepID=UPI0020420467|nr:hypothetical protein [Paenibacillus pasadenensis]MCM3747468.1 hypothetical protein [Paenibacillus pasadenensis]